MYCAASKLRSRLAKSSLRCNFKVECTCLSILFVSALKMRWSLWIVGTLAALGALSVRVLAQEGGHGEPEVEATGGETTPFCNSSTEVLIEELLTLFSEYNTTINCLAFGPERNLESGVMSVFQTNGTPVGRYNLSCQSNALTARELNGQNASRMDIRDKEYHACVECNPTAEVPEDICDRRKSVLLTTNHTTIVLIDRN